MSSPLFVGIMRGKFVYDGSKTISDMVDSLVEEITLLRKMGAAGIELREEVDNDHAHLVTDDPEVAHEFGFRVDESTTRSG